ncbi:phage tail protein [Variovorax sp. CY25R-8]|uniref:phage tail protein n=1 Tax=Variovorax sp. CY25R-8 TaxID=2855501 RepID=UPI0021BBB5ED|nr:phage tail protein [Variovorax sp. CY25R-8]MCT8178128.1 phage tail protein [Variovorax sp. CY25R-8]
MPDTFDPADRVPAFQLNGAGLFIDVVPALESIAERGQGIYHVPSGAVIDPMPEEWMTVTRNDSGFFTCVVRWPADKWPRHDGHTWELVARPAATITAAPTAAEKLAAFIAANPDVAALINATTSPQE